MTECSLETTFSSRLKDLQGDLSVSEFARRCGIGESLMRKYLAGSVPGSDKADRIARAAGVRLEWLLSGEPPKLVLRQEGPVYQAHQLDEALLQNLITAIEQHTEAHRLRWSATKRARVIAHLYALYERTGAIDDESFRRFLTMLVDS